jgi:hypothetical protein
MKAEEKACDPARCQAVSSGVCALFPETSDPCPRLAPGKEHLEVAWSGGWAGQPVTQNPTPLTFIECSHVWQALYLSNKICEQGRGIVPSPRESQQQRHIQIDHG